MLLYGVPFHYLVPDGEMLPAESIRFFYLNPEWINCLLQGACSVGRTSQTDELVDQLLRARFFEVSEKLASSLRSSAKQAADGRTERWKPDGTAATEKDGQPFCTGPCPAICCAPPAVESWIGLEAKADGVDSADKRLDPLQILRMDRLAPDILLCIYNGKSPNIEVKQPPEAIHFGAAIKSSESGSIRRSGCGAIKGTRIRSGIDTRLKPSDCVERIEARAARRQRVSIGHNLAKKTGEKRPVGENDFVTSAEFAVEMIESPAKVTFTVNRTTVMNGGHSSMSDYLLVPINVQAFLVGKPDTGTLYDLAPVPRSEEDVSAWYRDKKYSFSFQSKLESPLGSGVHLHWALPAALMQSRHEAGKKPAQPCIPNRWLALRMWRCG